MNMATSSTARILERMTSVVLAEFSADRSLLHGNAGFTRLKAGTRSEAWFLFTQPRLDTLLGREPDDEGRVYAGLLTLGQPEGRMRTVTGEVFLENGCLTVLAGYDMDEMEMMQEHVLELNGQLCASQRELARSHQELARREETILQMSLTDSLTGVGNRRWLDESLAVETERAQRYGTGMSLAMIDIDLFKSVNDTWGHEVGDLVLKSVGELLRNVKRQSDMVARWGGEEFVVLMPATSLDDAVAAAERLRRAMELLTVAGLVQFTASFGVACLQPLETGQALLARADHALYAAKRAGRNRVVAATDIADSRQPE